MPHTHPKTQYGLLCYDTENIGDEVQSIAASRFLPHVDFLINRDNIDSSILTANCPRNTKLIINGWLLNPSDIDGKFHWPPQKLTFSPLFTSIHIANNGSASIFNTSEGINFLKKFEPIGTRDTATQAFLTSIGIKAYFSGCLTLTLIPDHNIKKQDYILAVDVSDAVFQNLQQRTQRRIIRMNTSHSVKHSQDERFTIAKYWLALYQSAHCVITTRLHTMLPCLALDTPVIAISGRDPGRYSGLIELLNHYTEKEFIKNKNISIDHPITNPSSFLSIRKNLIKTCSDYTGYDSKTSYLHKTNLNILTNLKLVDIFTKSIDGIRYYEHLTDRLNQDINRLTAQNKTLTEQNTTLSHPGVRAATRMLLQETKKAISTHIHKAN